MRERRDFNLMQGDCNAKLVMDMPSSKSIGKFRIGSSNESGVKLVHLALENNLKIVNTVSEKSERKKWTWKFPNGITKNELHLCKQFFLITYIAVLWVRFSAFAFLTYLVR